jgi:hydrogenase maturation protease
MGNPLVTILGVGNFLFTDEGFGIRVIEKLQTEYRFPEEVHVVDGGVLGINLLGVIAQPDHLIVVDAMCNGGKAGDLYRLAGEEIPRRVLAKNSLHQVDLLEALTLCQALDKVPETVILGVEPEDIETLSLEMSPAVRRQVAPMAARVLQELDRLGVTYSRRSCS